MSPLRRATVAAALAATMVALPLPAGAGTEAPSLNVSPTTVRPGGTVDASILSDCPGVAFTVTLAYSTWERDTATVSASGTTDASGEAVQQLVVPEGAVYTDVTTAQATLDGCGATNTANVAIEPYDGTLAVDPGEGTRGTVVTITGTNCWGGAVGVDFGDGDSEDFHREVAGETLDEDRTFSATYTIPADAPGGWAEFTARCPGTVFEPVPFRVVVVADDGELGSDPGDPEGTGSGDGSGDSGEPNVPEAVPAGPIPGVVTVTG